MDQTPDPPPAGPTNLSEEDIASEFAAARFGALEHMRRLAQGIYCCRCQNGEALVVLPDSARMETVAVDAARDAGLLDTLVANSTPQGLVVRVTRRDPARQLRDVWHAGEHPVRCRGWVAAPKAQFAKLALACPPVRQMVMRRGRVSEQTVWANALALALDDDPGYLAHRLPYPASEYEPTITTAIAELPHRLRGYARELADATYSGERPPHVRWRPNRHRHLTVKDASMVGAAIDRAISRVRHMHLAPGREVWVQSPVDETVWPGRVSELHLDQPLAVEIRVAYPPGYRSPEGHRPLNPTTFSLRRIIEPPSPLPAKAALAHREGVPIPSRRRFDIDS